MQEGTITPESVRAYKRQGEAFITIQRKVILIAKPLRQLIGKHAFVFAVREYRLSQSNYEKRLTIVLDPKGFRPTKYGTITSVAVVRQLIELLELKNTDLPKSFKLDVYLQRDVKELPLTQLK